jgi:hypothetical protein
MSMQILLKQFKTWYSAKVPIKPGHECALLCTSFSTELYTETFAEYQSEIYASYKYQPTFKQNTNHHAWTL